FAIAKFETVQAAYSAVTGKHPSRRRSALNSTEMVDWNDAVAFCAKVTLELRNLKLISINEVVRLPTEAEWEYACRAGSNTAYHFGNEVNELPKYAWFNRFLREQHKPGDSILPNPWKKKLPNMWGLYDMHGCVWEWCTDYYHDS